MRVSVVIPCHNAAAYIAQTLESVFSQQLADCEIIVVDDGSTDGSGDIVRRFAKVRAVETHHRGPSHARNVGLSLATGDFIQYLDADDLLAPGKLAAQVPALQATGADVAYGDWIRFQDGASDMPPAGERVSRVLSSPLADLLTDFWCPLASYLMCRSFVQNADPWPEDMWYVEDVRYLLQCARAGARFEYCPQSLTCYRVREGSLSTEDPVGFARGCLSNANQVRVWWREDAGRDEALRRALLRSYSWVAHASAGLDAEVCRKACDRLDELQPGYVPTGMGRLTTLARVLGFRRSVGLAACWRRLRHAPHRRHPR
ncbi:MAG: glycosyltransferase family 2 protein [Candidatus Xenobia bacterium]